MLEGEDCQCTEPQDRTRGTKQPLCQLPRGPIINPWCGTGGRAETHTHACVSPSPQSSQASFTDTHTQIQRASNGPSTLTLICFSYPFSHLPTPHFFIFHAASLVRLPADTSHSDSPDLRGGGGELGGCIFGEMERREGRGAVGGGEGSNNKSTANDGMPGSSPQRAGLRTDQQLPKSI